MILRFHRLFLAGLFAAVSAARGGPPPVDAEPPWADMPWHLVDLEWNFAGPVSARDYSITVTIEGLSPGEVPIFIAPAGGAERINGQDFYGGLQTRADGGDLADTTYGEIGPAFIFSRWGDRARSNIRTVEGGFCQSSSHEGDFVSVRKPHPWQAGHYIFRWTELERETTPEGIHTWVRLKVRDVERNLEFDVGALRFRGAGLNLSGALSSFIEIYGLPRSASSIPSFAVTFSDPRADGRSLAIRGVAAYFHPGVPALATVVPLADNAIQIRISPPPRPRGSDNTPPAAAPSTAPTQP